MGGNGGNSEIISAVDGLDRLLIRPGCRSAILVVMPNNLHCSFCNQSEDQTGPLLAKMEVGPKRHPVRICKGCAEMAIDTIDREVLRRAAEQPRLRVI
jgi:hypothetical protein